MKIDRTKNTIRNTLFGSLNKIVGIVFPFIIRTIIIKVLGVEYLGLSSLFTSILQILSLAELGFGTALTFSMYKPIAEDDEEAINALLNLYKKVYRIIGIIVLCVGLVFVPLLPHLIEGDYPNNINIYVLYAIYLANTVISYLFFAYRNALLTAHQRNDVSSKISILTSCVLYIGQIVLLLLFKNYYIYCVVLPITTLLNNFLTLFTTKKLYPKYKCQGTIQKQEKKVIQKQIYSLFLHRIGYVIQSSIDNICISAFMGLVLLGRYNNYYYIVTAVQAFITILKQSMVAGIGNSLVVESKEYNKKYFNKILFIMIWIIGWCATCLMCLFQPFMQIWVGTENMLPLTVVISLVVLFYVNEIRGTIVLYKDALGMWYEDRFKPISISIVNLILTIISAHFGFIEGIVLASAIASFVVGMPWETIVFFKKYMEESPKRYLLKQLMYFIINFFALVITYILCSFIISGISGLVIRLVICLIVPNVIFIFCNIKNPALKEVLKLFKKPDKVMSNIKKLFSKINSLLKKSFSLVFYILPIDKKKITFANFFGKGYGCNPKYLAEEFLKDGNYKLIWFVSDVNDESIPEGVQKVKYGSLKHYYHMITAKLWIENIRNGIKPIFKRKGQVYLQTWHSGIGIKGIERDVEESLSKNYVKKSKKSGKWEDYILSGSDFQTNQMKRAFWTKAEIVKLGIPREDGLLEYNKNIVEDVKKQFNIQNKKIILYAPSFRVNRDFYKNLCLDVKKLQQSFENKFGGEFIVAVRLHPNDAIDENKAIFKDALDFNLISDSNIALQVSDYLISDYSTVVFDFARLGKPSFIFAPDYDAYVKNERKLYINLRETCFAYAETFEDLLSNISNLKNDVIKTQNEWLDKTFGIYNINNSSKMVKDFLISRM